MAAAALGLGCLSCGSTAEEPKTEACEVAGRETDFCGVLAQQAIACSESTEPAETLIAQCHARLEDYPNRVAPCFVAELGDCLATGCGSDDKCTSDALVANDPSLVNMERYRSCADPKIGRETSATETVCDDFVAGSLEACLDRTHECSVLDDLCTSLVAMKQPYRGNGEACIQGSCDELEGCLYAALGRTKRF